MIDFIGFYLLDHLQELFLYCCISSCFHFPDLNDPEVFCKGCLFLDIHLLDTNNFRSAYLKLLAKPNKLNCLHTSGGKHFNITTILLFFFPFVLQARR